MSYNSKYKGAEVDAALDKANSALQAHQDISGKQDVISDLDTIREGASKGATALQSIPSEYVTESELTAKGYATTSALAGKVDKVTGKQLTTEDFTTALKTKLEGLNNYDDSAIQEAVEGLQSQLNTLVSGDVDTAIESFNEIIAFLEGVADTETLEGIIASIEQQIAAKYTKPSSGIPKSDLASAVQTSLGKADTALQSHQSLDGYVKDTDLASVATSGSYNDLTNKPTIPSEVTESTVSGWGFTKNTGTYIKPSAGIPLSDLASSVQTSLGKADTALQSHQDISGKQDVLVSGTNIKTINGTSILGSGNIAIEGGGGGGDGYLPLEGGTVTGDLTVMGTITTPTPIVASGGVEGKLVSTGSSHSLGIDSDGDIWWDDKTIITKNGDGTCFLSDDGTYKSLFPAYPEEFHGPTGTKFTLTPNVFHVWDEVTSLTLTFGDETAGVANEFLFQFNSGATATTLTLPDTIKWANNSVPTIEANKTYQISILKGLASVLVFDNTPIVPIVFYVNDVEYTANDGMTWLEYAESEYNTQDYNGEAVPLCLLYEPYDVYWLVIEGESANEYPIFEDYENLHQSMISDTIIANHHYTAMNP